MKYSASAGRAVDPLLSIQPALGRDSGQVRGTDHRLGPAGRAFEREFEEDRLPRAGRGAHNAPGPAVLPDDVVDQRQAEAAARTHVHADRTPPRLHGAVVVDLAAQLPALMDQVDLDQSFAVP